jgi:hypothetical protein
VTDTGRPFGASYQPSGGRSSLKNNAYKYVFCLTDNTLCPRYKVQADNAVWGNTRRLLQESERNDQALRKEDSMRGGGGENMSPFVIMQYQL